MNSKNKMTITLTKVQRQTLKVPMLVARLRCPACDAEFEMRSESTDGTINLKKGITLTSKKP